MKDKSSSPSANLFVSVMYETLVTVCPIMLSMVLLYHV